MKLCQKFLNPCRILFHSGTNFPETGKFEGDRNFFICAFLAMISSYGLGGLYCFCRSPPAQLPDESRQALTVSISPHHLVAPRLPASAGQACLPASSGQASSSFTHSLIH